MLHQRGLEMMEKYDSFLFKMSRKLACYDILSRRFPDGYEIFSHAFFSPATNFDSLTYATKIDTFNLLFQCVPDGIRICSTPYSPYQRAISVVCRSTKLHRESYTKANCYPI